MSKESLEYKILEMSLLIFSTRKSNEKNLEFPRREYDLLYNWGLIGK